MSDSEMSIRGEMSISSTPSAGGRPHRVTIGLEYDVDIEAALTVLDKLNAFLYEVRKMGVAVDCQVVVTPDRSTLSPALLHAVERAEGARRDADA